MLRKKIKRVFRRRKNDWNANSSKSEIVTKGSKELFLNEKPLDLQTRKCYLVPWFVHGVVCCMCNYVLLSSFSSKIYTHLLYRRRCFHKLRLGKENTHLSFSRDFTLPRIYYEIGNYKSLRIFKLISPKLHGNSLYFLK